MNKDRSKVPIQQAPIQQSMPRGPEPGADKGAIEDKTMAPIHQIPTIQETPIHGTDDKTEAQIQQTPPSQETQIHAPEDKTEAQIQRIETPQQTGWVDYMTELKEHVFGENETEDAPPISELRSGTSLDPSDKFPVGVYDITASTMSHPVQVRSGIELSSSLITSLDQDGIVAVNVVKVEFDEVDEHVRALIESPAGWISLLDTRNGFRWAENRAAFCQYRPIDICDMSNKCYGFALDCLPQKLTVTVHPHGWGEDEVFPLGTYDLLEEAIVKEGPSLDSKTLYQFGDLPSGEPVNVLKIEYVPTESRVRAQIEQPPKGLVGWISLLDTSDSFRWAQNRAAFCATNVNSRFGLYRVKWCEWNHDKCHWDQEAGKCTAKPYPSEAYLASTPITTTVDPKYVIIKATTTTTTTPDPEDAETLQKAEAERIAKEKAEAERAAKEKAEAERIAKEKAEAPPKPESPETAGKDNAARPSAGTCAMAALLLLLHGFQISL